VFIVAPDVLRRPKFGILAAFGVGRGLDGIFGDKDLWKSQMSSSLYVNPLPWLVDKALTTLITNVFCSEVNKGNWPIEKYENFICAAFINTVFRVYVAAGFLADLAPPSITSGKVLEMAGFKIPKKQFEGLETKKPKFEVKFLLCLSVPLSP